MMRSHSALVGFLLLGACTAGAARPSAPRSQATAGFWDHWGDGRAELAGYTLVTPRYGQLRQGEAILITVTEELAADTLVKAETPQPRAFPVLKLNDVRDFQTGLYDYNLMTSVFVPLDGRTALGTPAKVAFSSQEWCGHVFDQVRVDGDRARHTWHSYFEGEGDGQKTVDLGGQVLFGDAMNVLVRDLSGTLVEPGTSMEVAYWPRSQTSRFQHRAASLGRASLTRERETRTIQVPAGRFEVRRTTLTHGRLSGTWDVEVAPPHRLVAWSWSDGERGELTGSERLPYWSLASEGDEALRARLGLTPRAASSERGTPVENSGD